MQKDGQIFDLRFAIGLLVYWFISQLVYCAHGLTDLLTNRLIYQIKNRKSKIKNSSDHGYSTVELIITLIVIGIMAAMAIPRIGNIGEYSAHTTASRLVADLRYARRLAITTTKNHIVKFHPSGGPYTEYKLFREVITEGNQVGVTRRIPEQVTCTGTEEFTFQPLGNATSDGTVSFSSGDKQYDVKVIAATGWIYEEEA